MDIVSSYWKSKKKDERNGGVIDFIPTSTEFSYEKKMFMFSESSLGDRIVSEVW